MKKRILILNGPNINFLHKRNPNIYGEDVSLSKIEYNCNILANEIGIDLHFFQSNSEGVLVSQVQNAIEEFDGIIINAAAYSHTSIAIRDALEMFKKPIIELHISNIYKRDEFRKKSYLSEVCSAVISGLGINGYTIALLAIKDM